MIGSRRRARSVFPVPSYLGVSKNELERRIATRREKTDNHKNQWNSYSSYIQKEGVQAEYQDRWSRPSSSVRSISAKTAKILQVKREVLARKSRLATLLREENEMYRKELEARKEHEKSSDIQAVLDRVEELKKAKELTRRSEAQDKKLQMWRRDNPRVRSAHVEKRRQEMVDLWSGQLEHREEEQRELERERERDAEKTQREAEQERLEKQLAAEKRRAEQEALRAQLTAQMRELEAQEARQNQLKNEERELMVNQERLEQAQIRQKQKAEAEKKKEHRSILFRQYRAQLLRRAHQMEEELEHDLALLERIKIEEQEEAKLKQIKINEAKLCSEEAIELLRLKLKEEKQAQEEIEMLYRDQAEQWWEKRQAEWDTEKRIRKQLLQDVLDERREQIQDKLEQNRENQINVLKDRQNLIKSIENDKRIASEQQEKVKIKKQNLLEGLRGQLEDRDELIRREIDQIEKENLETAKTQRELDDLEEAEVANIMTQPRSIRQAW